MRSSWVVLKVQQSCYSEFPAIVEERNRVWEILPNLTRFLSRHGGIEMTMDYLNRQERDQHDHKELRSDFLENPKGDCPKIVRQECLTYIFV